MKKLLLAAVAFGAVSTVSALAADLPMPVKAPPAPIDPPVSWTGCYVGAEGGYTFGQMSAVGTTGATAGLPFTSGNMSGGLVGGTVGCNYQISNWVVGLENDLSWTSYGVNTTEILPFLGQTQTSTSWLDTFRGRVGYAWGHSLFYVTGGGAYTNLRIFQAAVPFTPVTATLTNNLLGWTIGGGIEQALPFARWSVKAEYLYINYGNSSYGFNPATGGVFSSTSVRLNENVVRIGLNYKFY